MESVLSGATKKVLEMARKKDKFIEDSAGGGKMFSAAKLVAKGRTGKSVEFVFPKKTDGHSSINPAKSKFTYRVTHLIGKKIPLT